MSNRYCYKCNRSPCCCNGQQVATSTAPEFGAGAPGDSTEGYTYFDLSQTPAAQYVKTDGGWVAVGSDVNAALLVKNPVVDLNYDATTETLTVTYCDGSTKPIELPDLMQLPTAP